MKGRLIWSASAAATVWITGRRSIRRQESPQGGLDTRLHIDRHFPGIAGAVVHHEMSIAETMRDYLNMPGGAVYGFSPDIDAPGAFPPGPRTAIPSLWPASAFTLSGGFTGAMMGGALAATEAMQWMRKA
jgi:phytoene dehydrogenase-like protein